MRLTIIPSDKAVYKDSLCYLGLDLSLAGLPADVHALQWDNNAGWIEYKNYVKPNETISTLPQWANNAVTVWQQAYDAEQAAILEAQQAAILEAQQAATQNQSQGG